MPFYFLFATIFSEDGQEGVRTTWKDISSCRSNLVHTVNISFDGIWRHIDIDVAPSDRQQWTYIKKKIKSKNIICVAPDVGGTERARALGKILNVGLAIVDKRRPKPGQSQVMNVIGNVKDKTCIIVDDIIDSGGTIINSAKALKERGAKEVYVYITHGVLSGDAVKKIRGSVIKNLVITDTIDNGEKVKNAKNIELLSISGLMGEAIKRISNSTSVSDLFK